MVRSTEGAGVLRGRGRWQCVRTVQYTAGVRIAFQLLLPCKLPLTKALILIKKRICKNQVHLFISEM